MKYNKQITNDIIEWDVKNWSRALDFWESESAAGLRGCYALDIGARNGGLTLWLTLQGAHVACSDINEPSEAAKVLHEKYEVSHSIEYHSIDATDIPYPENVFDAEIEEFLSPFSSYEYLTTGFFGVFGRSERQRYILGNIDTILTPFLPVTWKYIIYGIAKK